MKIGGVIYLYEISQTRMLGSARKNLAMFRKLCGEDALKKVVLGTTKWGEITDDVGQRREQQLRDNFWKEMIDEGSQMRRFLNTPESAWEMVSIILQNFAKHIVPKEQRSDGNRTPRKQTQTDSRGRTAKRTDPDSIPSSHNDSDTLAAQNDSNVITKDSGVVILFAIFLLCHITRAHNFFLVY
jgi:hypothetical protein